MKILVPIDFSELSEKALQIADQYAKLFKGKITPFHAHVPISELDEPYGLGMSTKMYEDYQRLEDSLREKVDSTAQKLVAKTRLEPGIVSMGNPAHAITDTAEEFDYIIMSTHGRTGFTRFLLGSVAEKVLRLSHIPVIIVEDKSEVDGFKKLLVTTDFSDNAASAYPYAVQLAKKTGASIDLIHVLSFDQFEDEESDVSIQRLRKERLQLITKEYFHEVSDQVNPIVIHSGDSPHEAIYKHVKENSYHLVIMATVGRTGINYMMMGSTTANVVRHVDNAVLSINPKRREK